MITAACRCHTQRVAEGPAAEWALNSFGSSCLVARAPAQTHLPHPALQPVASQSDHSSLACRRHPKLTFGFCNSCHSWRSQSAKLGGCASKPATAAGSGRAQRQRRETQWVQTGVVVLRDAKLKVHVRLTYRLACSIPIVTFAVVVAPMRWLGGGIAKCSSQQSRHL